MSTSESNQLQHRGRAGSLFARGPEGGPSRVTRLLGAAALLGLAAVSNVIGCSTDDSTGPDEPLEKVASNESALTSDVRAGSTFFRKTQVRVGTCDTYGNGCSVETRWTPVTDSTCSATTTTTGIYPEAIAGVKDCTALGDTLLKEFKTRHPDAGEVSVTTTSSTTSQCAVCDGPDCCFNAGSIPVYGGSTPITKCVAPGASTLCSSTPCCTQTGTTYGGGAASSCKKVGEAFDLNDIAFCRVTLSVTPCSTRTDGKTTSCKNSCLDISTSHDNCGSCDTVCRSDQACSTASCICQQGNECNGRCRDYSSDHDNCGSCGHACRNDQICSGGGCICASGLNECNGRCVNYSSDKQNCGSCGSVCRADQTCSGGTCVCPAGTSLCGGRCINVSSDESNCGGCGRACGANQECISGTCKNTGGTWLYYDFSPNCGPAQVQARDASGKVICDSTVNCAFGGSCFIAPGQTYGIYERIGYCSNTSLGCACTPQAYGVWNYVASVTGSIGSYPNSQTWAPCK